MLAGATGSLGVALVLVWAWYKFTIASGREAAPVGCFVNYHDRKNSEVLRILRNAMRSRSKLKGKGIYMTINDRKL